MLVRTDAYSHHACPRNYKMQQKYWCAHTHMLACVCAICVRAHTLIAHTHTFQQSILLVHTGFREKYFFIFLVHTGIRKECFARLENLIEWVCERFFTCFESFHRTCVCARQYFPLKCVAKYWCAHTHIPSEQGGEDPEAALSHRSLSAN